MPSTENAALQLIQQEIADVLERERELKKHYSSSSNGQEEGAANGYYHEPERNGSARPVYARAKSTSALETGSAAKPSLRRFVSAQPAKGVMHRFFKTRGRLSTAAQAPRTRTAFGELVEGYDLQPAKVEPGQRARKGFVSAEVKIQRDIEETFRRETELKTLRQSRSNLTSLGSEDDLDAPLPPYLGHGLRASKSLMQLCSSSETLDDAVTASAPSSLKPARSSAQLCEEEEEDSEAKTPRTLIRFFERMNIKNQNTKRS